MNKLIASTAFVVATALSGAAFADNPTDVNAGGNAQQIGHLGPIQVTQEFSPQFINPVTSVVNPGEKKIRFFNSFINYAGQLGIKSANGAITTAGVAPAGWVDKVNYTATATFGTSSAAYTTNGSVVPTLGVNKDNDAAGPAGPATVNVSLLLIPSALPAIAGAYNDVVTVVLGAGV